MGQQRSDLNSIWQTILGELEVSLSGHSFKTFVKPVILESVQGNAAVLVVPNPFSSAQIKARFENDILDALANHIEGIEKIDYVIRSTAQPANVELELPNTITWPQYKSNCTSAKSLQSKATLS